MVLAIFLIIIIASAVDTHTNNSLFISWAEQNGIVATGITLRHTVYAGYEYIAERKLVSGETVSSAPI